MTDGKLEASVRESVEDLHRFFVDWFSGVAPRSELDTRFASVIDAECFYVTPDCARFDRAALLEMMSGAHGANPDFRIEIRSVVIRRDLGDAVLATYTEWQSGAKASAAENARLTTALLTKARPHRWLHIHETWLPAEERRAGFEAA